VSRWLRRAAIVDGHRPAAAVRPVVRCAYPRGPDDDELLAGHASAS